MSNGKKPFWSGDLLAHCEAGCYTLIVFTVVLTFWIGAKFFAEVKDITRPSLSAPTVSISAEGSVFVRPDIGLVSFSVESEEASVADAQKNSARVINDAVGFLKNSGVEDKDLKTTSYTINSVYDYPKGRRVFLGYQVRQTMELKIRDLNKTGSFLSGLAKVGVNEVGSLVFKLDDPDKAKEEARDKAVAEAKKKARTLADSLGVRLGKIVSFNEFSSSPIPIFAVEAFGKGGDISGAVVPSTPTGENEITSSVNITFEIK
ncbi:MAG: SIMPL domain-containing protein [Candidatus Niyogibacteria bacterium]|nr:MAG: SIMPL domain-containing protein [Candidatus Niyogibacteria bacterium]